MIPLIQQEKCWDAAKSGDAVLLSEVLQQIDASERVSEFGNLWYNSTPLLLAAEHGHLDCVKVLLKYKADIGSGSDDDDEDGDNGFDDDDVTLMKASEFGEMDFQDVLGVTPLIKASENGHMNVVTFLVEQGANMNLQDQEGNTPLMLASENGHMNVVSFLVEHGAKMDLQDKQGDSPPMSATIRGQRDLVTFCVEHGANVDHQDKGGNTALMLASKNGHMNVVTYLVESGANIDLQDKNGKSPLMIHVASDHCSRMNIATFLIEQGAKVNLQDKEGKTALHHAIENNSRRHGDSHRNLEAVFETVRCLIKNGANVDATTNDNCTPLMIASKEGEVRVIDLLIKHGANVNLQDEEGKTALYRTIENDSQWHGDSHFKVVFETVRCLIKNGANVNASTNDNCTPLMIASTECNKKVINLLMKHGANVDLRDEDGRTALHHAIESFSCFRWTSVNTLIENGANVNATTNDNCTPLMLASAEGDVIVIDLLIKHGANVDLQDKYGRTALFYAVTVGGFYWRDIRLETVQCFIKNGADVNTSGNDNCTPLMMATCAVANKFSKVDLLTILIEHGANMDLQDKNGDTALHYAMKRIDECTHLKGHDFDPCKVVNTLLTCGAAQLCNNQQLTPLLLASNKGMDFMVENLIKILEYTKKQRVDALELLGATLVACSLEFEEGFEYIKRGMEERFQDSSHPLLKQPMDPIEAYENKKECQTLEELARINGTHAILMESLIIRERILGTGNRELLGPIRHAADYYECRDSYKHKCIGLYRHAMKIAQQCNQSVTSDLNHITSVLYEKGWWNVPPRQKDFVLELLEQTVLEYEKQQKLGNDFSQQRLFTSLIRLVQIIAKFKHLEENKTSHVSVLLQKICRLNPRNDSRYTLLHKAVEYVKRSKPRFAFEINTPRPLYKFPCISTVKLLLNSGINVDAFSSNGDTPLHKAVMYIPSSNNIHCLTSILEALLDGGAHHDFVNNDGKTAMDMAETDEARMILSEKRKLELKCISARAVKKFGLPYLGVVPKTLEKFISRH